jgi:hypothetical protein
MCNFTFQLQLKLNLIFWKVAWFHVFVQESLSGIKFDVECLILIKAEKESNSSPKKKKPTGI